MSGSERDSDSLFQAFTHTLAMDALDRWMHANSDRLSQSLDSIIKKVRTLPELTTKQFLQIQQAR